MRSETAPIQCTGASSVLFSSEQKTASQIVRHTLQPLCVGYLPATVCTEGKEEKEDRYVTSSTEPQNGS